MLRVGHTGKWYNDKIYGNKIKQNSILGLFILSQRNITQTVVGVFMEIVNWTYTYLYQIFNLDWNILFKP